MTDEKLDDLNNRIARIWLDAEQALDALVKPLSDEQVLALIDYWKERFEKEAAIKPTDSKDLPGGYWNFLNRLRTSLYARRLFADAAAYVAAHPDAKAYCPLHQSHLCWEQGLHGD